MITSKSNENVKFIKNLNEKKFRNKFNCFYLEGVKVTNETLDIYLEGAVEIISIAYSFDILSKVNGGTDLLNKINDLKNNNIKFDNVNIYEFNESIFNYITDTVNTQGVIIVVKIKEKSLDDLNLNSNIIILDKIGDLGNLGTIIRTADSFYFKNIICIKGTADVYAPKALRATMVSILRTNIVYIDDIEDIDCLKKYLNSNNYKTIATSLNTDKSLKQYDGNNKIAIILGNEANGVSEELINISDDLVKIPMNSKVDSLNVAVASSILMYELGKKII